MLSLYIVSSFILSSVIYTRSIIYIDFFAFFKLLFFMILKDYLVYSVIYYLKLTTKKQNSYNNYEYTENRTDTITRVYKPRTYSYKK